MEKSGTLETLSDDDGENCGENEGDLSMLSGSVRMVGQCVFEVCLVEAPIEIDGELGKGRRSGDLFSEYSGYRGKNVFMKRRLRKPPL